MLRKFTSLLLTLIFFSFSPISPARAENSEPLTVMSRNIYLGADVGVAMKLLPNFPAAAQFMWDQVRQTDFSQRAPKLAAEFAAQRPAVIGIQEATIWYCKKDLWSGKVEVFNFLTQLIDATKKTGTGYSLAVEPQSNIRAFNPGYSIAAIPYLTKVKDPSTFQPLFKQDSASCGFTIGDALLIRDDLRSKILAVGNSEYDASYSIIPALMTIYRGYSWLDLKYNNSQVRIVTTHLESIWDQNKIPNSVLQAKQLISDLSTSTMPLIVMGDFNADYRDPRSKSEPNPGGQPVVGKACPTPAAQECNPYLMMLSAGYSNVSPDAKDPKNFSWGATALLDGPDKERDAAAKAMGNEFGFTDRLDYIFTKNISTALNSQMVGNTYPDGLSIWDCGAKKCFATDHAGVVATVGIARDQGDLDIGQRLPSHNRSPIGIWHLAFAAIVTLVIWRFAHSRNAR